MVNLLTHVMQKIDFNNKTFVLIDNSEKGKVNSRTVFKYFQEGDLVTADYSGGPIRTGKIIARLEGMQLHMLYQCLTIQNELKAGRATADIVFNEHDKLHLKLKWEWLGSPSEKGTSEYLEL